MKRTKCYMKSLSIQYKMCTIAGDLHSWQSNRYVEWIACSKEFTIPAASSGKKCLQPGKFSLSSIACSCWMFLKWHLFHKWRRFTSEKKIKWRKAFKKTFSQVLLKYTSYKCKHYLDDKPVICCSKQLKNQ